MSVAIDISQVEGITMGKVGKINKFGAVGAQNFGIKDGKKIFTARISSSGQVTLPAEVRRILGVEKSEKIRFEVSGNEVVVKKPMTWEEYFENQQARIDELKRKNPKFAKAWEENKGKTANEMREEWMNSPEGKAYYKEKYGV